MIRVHNIGTVPDVCVWTVKEITSVIY